MLDLVHEVKVVQFVPNDQIDPIMLERSYYLEPDSKSPKAYALLVKTLENTELTAVVRFALRQKTRLGALRVRGSVLVLQGILWDDEVREADFPATQKKTKISSQELKMSSTLVEQFKGDFNPEEFEDEYQLELHTLIEEKIELGDSLDTPATFGDKEAAVQPADTGSGDVIDLMAALKRSIDKKRAGTASAKPASAKPAAAKDATGTKTGNAKKKAAQNDMVGKSGSKARSAAASKSTGTKDSAMTGRTAPRIKKGA